MSSQYTASESTLQFVQLGLLRDYANRARFQYKVSTIAAVVHRPDARNVGRHLVSTLEKSECTRCWWVNFFGGADPVPQCRHDRRARAENRMGYAVE